MVAIAATCFVIAWFGAVLKKNNGINKAGSPMTNADRKELYIKPNNKLSKNSPIKRYVNNWLFLFIIFPLFNLNYLHKSINTANYHQAIEHGFKDFYNRPVIKIVWIYFRNKTFIDQVYIARVRVFKYPYSLRLDNTESAR